MTDSGENEFLAGAFIILHIIPLLPSVFLLFYLCASLSLSEGAQVAQLQIPSLFRSQVKIIRGAAEGWHRKNNDKL